MNIGIDIGGSHIASGIVDDNGNLIGKETRDIELSDVSKEEIKNLIIETIINETNTLLDKYGILKSDICKIGIAAPGSPSKTSLKNLVNLHIDEFNIVDEILKYYDCQIKLKNDGKCAGIAEKKYGSLKEFDDAVFLCLGTGVGSAVFMNGELLEPKQSAGFEFGHVIIDKNGEEECNCGNIGCFETYASMKRFKKRAIKRFNLPENISSEELQNFIRTNMKEENTEGYSLVNNKEEIKSNIENYNSINDNANRKEEVREFVNEYIKNVAIGISNIINIFEPEAICFGGSFSYYEDIFIPILEEEVNKLKFNKQTKTKFVLSKLKNDAGIIGAAGLFDIK